MREFVVKTTARDQFIVIDAQVQAAVEASGVREGVCHVFVPHTTAGVTINENADPDVVRDLRGIFDRLVPWNGPYAHAEGNSAAHAKASIVGFSQAVFIHDGRLALGVWQSIYFCEFDGPRTRKAWVQIVETK